MTDPIHGQCLCGGVAFTLSEPGPISACHCRMCQRWTGSVFIDMMVEDDQIEFQRDDTLAWYNSSDWAQRGFCVNCGSSLFYRMKHDGAHWAVLVGSLDIPPGQTISLTPAMSGEASLFRVLNTDDAAGPTCGFHELPAVLRRGRD